MLHCCGGIAVASKATHYTVYPSMVHCCTEFMENTKCIFGFGSKLYIRDIQSTKIFGASEYFSNDSVEYILRRIQDLSIKIPEWFTLVFNQAKNKQIFITKIFINHEYFGGFIPLIRRQIFSKYWYNSLFFWGGRGFAKVHIFWERH